MEDRKVSMKKILVGLLVAGSLATASAQVRAQSWVGPALIGGVIGYSLNSPRYYYGPYGYTVPPVIYSQAPTVVYQQPPVVVQSNQICEEKIITDVNGQTHKGVFCYNR